MATPDPHTLVEELFQAADHDLTIEVGAAPGTIVRIARPRVGLLRPKIVWAVSPEWPAVLDVAFTELEQLRAAAAADRAILIAEANPPAAQEGAVSRGPLDVMTVRRFAFLLANIEEHLAEMRALFEGRIGELFFPRRVEIDGGTTMDAIVAIVSWCEGAAPNQLLWVVGDHGSGRSTAVLAAGAAIARQFFASPDVTRPILSLSTYPRWELARLMRDQGLVVLWDDDQDRVDVFDDWTGRIVEYATRTKEDLPPEVVDVSTVFRLVEPRPAEVAAWLGARFPARSALLHHLVSSKPDFGSLLTAPRGLEHWAAVLSRAWPETASGDAEIVALLMTALLTSSVPDDLRQDPILEWALEDFAIGRCSIPDALGELESSARNQLVDMHGWRVIRDKKFQYALLRDYFLAHKIIADVRAGRREILTRHQFPREFVLLFLAILSPEVAALAGEDRSRAMHDEIAAEIEREVQLALTHNLKHPIARIRGALTDARKKLAPPERDRITEELAQIEEATRHIAALVEKTSQWSQIPDEPPEVLNLALAVERALEPFRREWSDVRVAVELLAEAHVQVGPITLQTILSNLLENAFQAVDANGPERRVAVRLLRTGETIRIEVIDTGPGVHEDDRERIFRPRVTTKKGGRGKPRGTGMGLPIARKYAEHIGGRVWLNPEASQTTFVLELVPAREVPHDR